ncbi:hypothetical protein ACLGIH_05955 [Streptomyces sp. HMX87]|uniref:hypothetical protein n=1 Tax=Streptomyces sp. HMX87 TaxID=3390849 RepID=UPI003A871DF6
MSEPTRITASDGAAPAAPYSQAALGTVRFVAATEAPAPPKGVGAPSAAVPR